MGIHVKTLQRGSRLVVASHNKGKVWEINELLAPYGLDAISAGDLGLSEPEETETSFEGNARLKAGAAAIGSGLPALADDSGLEVECLGGEPGIYSARWAGPGKDFGFAMKKVAEAIAGCGGWNVAGGAGPRANFISVLCLAWPDGNFEIFEGKIFGHLVWPPRGGNGFGYDPMFVPDGEVRTFGEMEPAEKYAISHRTRAFAAFKAASLWHLKPQSVAPAGNHGPDHAALEAAAASLSTRAEFVQFVARLRKELHKSGHGDVDAIFAGVERALEAQNDTVPPWRAIAQSLAAAVRS